MALYEHIKDLQRQLFAALGFSDRHAPMLGQFQPPEHNPELLLIGCVDARLDPAEDIGIPRGSALIYRNIAALVAGEDSASGERLSVAAMLEFAICNMKVKKIIIMGHTGCGGVAACLEQEYSHEHHHIRDYLKPLDGARDAAIAEGQTKEEQARVMEQAAVLLSVQNLLGYQVVRDAIDRLQVELLAWIIDTGNKLIWEWDNNSNSFKPMGKTDILGQKIALS